MLTKTDLMFSKTAVHVALEAVGYAVNPDAQNPAEAIDCGHKATIKHGIAFATLLSIIAIAVLGKYSEQNGKSPEHAQQHALDIHSIICNEFNLNSDVLWNLRSQYINNNPNAGFLFQKAYYSSIRFCADAHESFVLRKIILAVAENNIEIQI